MKKLQIEGVFLVKIKSERVDHSISVRESESI